MFALLWKLSAALNGSLRLHAPTNRVINWLRTPRGLKWSIPVALFATSAYLGLMRLAIEGAGKQGFGWLNVLVFLFTWNALKFACMAALSPVFMLRNVIERLARLRRVRLA